MTDRALLQDLLSYLSIRTPTETLVKTSLPLIIPALGNAYALDSEGFVVGVKLGYAHGTQGALDRVVRFRKLQRLVFYAEEAVVIPPAISQLSHLHLLVLGGNITRLPSELFDLPLNLFSLGSQPAHAHEGSPSEPALISLALEMSSLATRVTTSSPYKEVHRHQMQRLEETIATVLENGDGGRGILRDAVLESNLKTSSASAVEAATQIERLVKQLTTSTDTSGGIFLRLSTLQDPPLEIVARGRDAARLYFRARNEGDLPLNEVKVLLVGHGSSGKTSLVRRVFGEPFDRNESQTHGINIRRWTTTTRSGIQIKANFWDFGGQEIMHATHQFFLSKRSLYILVLDGRKEEDAEYWLQHIESFGGDSPVLVVLNKTDEHPAFDVNRRFLQSKYKGIVGFHRISCATGDGVEELVVDLERRLEDVPIRLTRWPYNWFRVKQELETDNKAYISQNEYTALCERHGIGDVDSQETLVEFLNDLGVILHFHDLKLLDTHVLDPQWVTEAVYRIINSPLLAAKSGFLQLSELNKMLKRTKGAKFTYPSSKHRYI